jgi:hypothetical protein
MSSDADAMSTANLSATDRQFRCSSDPASRPRTGRLETSLMARIVLPLSDNSTPAAQPLGAVHLDAADPDIARRILPILGTRASFVLLSADDPVAPPALANPPPESVGKVYELIRVRGTPALTVTAVLAECCRKLDIVPPGDTLSMHRAVATRLERQARQGVNTILLLEDAGQLADEVLLAIQQLFRVGAHRLLPTLLIAAPAFLDRLQTPALDPLRDSIAAHFRIVRPAASPASAGAAESSSHGAPDQPARASASAIAAPGAAPAKGDSLAVMVQQAERLLKNLEARKPTSPPLPSSDHAAQLVPTRAGKPLAKPPDVQDLATILRGLRDELEPVRAVGLPDPRGALAHAPAEEPPAVEAEMEVLPVVVAGNARNWPRAVAVPLFATLYIGGSLAVGGFIVHLWQNHTLARSAEWLAAQSWFPALPALDRSAAVTAPGSIDQSTRPATAAVVTEPTTATPAATTDATGPEPVVAAVATYALSADLEPAARPTDPPIAWASAEPTAAPEAASSPPEASADLVEPSVAALSPAAEPDQVEPDQVEPAGAVGPPEVVVSAPPASEATPRAVPPAQIDVVVNRGDEVLATGDIAAARLLYGWAASAGDARAALALGRTHDPLYLAQTRALGSWADPDKAVEWYKLAEARGSREAAARLASLLKKTTASAD